jgi:hypothetical protein
MIIRILFAFLFSALVLFAEAQWPTHEAKDIRSPFGEKDETEYYSDDRFIVATTSEKGSMGYAKQVVVLDANSGDELGRGQIPDPLGKGLSRPSESFRKEFLLDNTFFHVHVFVNNKEQEISMFVQEFELPSFRVISEFRKIGSIPVKLKIASMMDLLSTRSNWSISEDGSKVLFYYDKLRTSDKEQVLSVHVFDRGFQPVWSGSYKIPFDSDMASIQNVVVNDQGVAYGLVRAWFRGRSTRSELGYDHDLYRMQGESLSSVRVEPDGGLDVSHAELGMVGNQPCVGAFLVDPGTTTNTVVGTLGIKYEEDMRIAGRDQGILKTPWNCKNYVYKSIHPRSDGGFYLVGSTHKDVVLGNKGPVYLTAVSFAGDGRLEWDACQIREDPFDRSHYAMVVKNDLWAVVSGDPQVKGPGEPKGYVKAASSPECYGIRFDRTGTISVYPAMLGTLPIRDTRFFRWSISKGVYGSTRELQGETKGGNDLILATFEMD